MRRDMMRGGERLSVILECNGRIKKAPEPRMHEHRIVQARQLPCRLDLDVPKRRYQGVIN